MLFQFSNGAAVLEPGSRFRNRAAILSCSGTGQGSRLGQNSMNFKYVHACTSCMPCASQPLALNQQKRYATGLELVTIHGEAL